MTQLNKPLLSRPARRRHARQRGALLLEAALAVGVAVSLVGLTISINREQEMRADAVVLGGEKRIILDAARNYIRDNRMDIIQDLFDSAQSGGAFAEISVDLSELIAAGYLSAVFTPGAALNRIAGQDYVLLLRAVFQSDMGLPATSLGEPEMDPFATGSIDPRFIDGDPLNEEIGIEAVLFSSGGNALPLGMAGRALDAAQRINAGFIFTGSQSRGSGGTMNFDTTGFAAFPEYASVSAGRFASPVSLGSVGVLGDIGGGIAPDNREVFLRCVGVDPTVPAYEDCASASRDTVYSQIRMTPFDSNNDGTIDSYPAITGATRILCLDAIGDEADAVDPDVFLIDCQTTQVNGILDVTGDAIRFAGETLVETRNIAGADETVVVADRVALRLPSGDERDLLENVFQSVSLAARDTIDVPECRDTAIDGSTLEPQATAQVAAALDPWGRAVSGVFAIAERGTGDSDSWTPDSTGDKFMARIRYTLNADYCESSFGNPINIKSIFADPDNPASAGQFHGSEPWPDIAQCNRPDPSSPGDVIPNSNNRADVYELYPVGISGNYGIATVSVSCGLPPASP